MGKSAKTKKNEATPMEIDSGLKPQAKGAKKGAKAPPVKNTTVDLSSSSDSEIEEVKPAKPLQKRVQKTESSTEESSSDEEEPVAKKPPVKAPPAKEVSGSSSDSEDEDDEPAPTKPAAVKKTPAPAKEESSDEDSSDESDSEDEIKKPTPAKVEESSTDDSSDDDDESDDEPAQKPAAKPQQTKQAATPVKPAKPAESSDEDESSSDEDDSDEEEEEDMKKSVSKPQSAVVAKTDSAKTESTKSEEDSDEESDEEDEEPKQPAKKQKLENGKAAATKVAEVKTPGQQGGSKTLFVGNLPYSATEDEIMEFFQDAGEVSAVRIAQGDNGPRGFAHVEFETEEGARKAVKKSGQELNGRQLHCDVARERGTPSTGGKRERDWGTSPGGNRKTPGKTIFVRGFDKFQEEDSIRNSLMEHFKECGQIERVRIPTDRETGSFKGFAYIEFSEEGASASAKELHGSELGGRALTVDDAAEPGGFQSGDRGRDQGNRGRGGRFDRGGGRGGRFDRGGRGRGDRGGRGGRGGPKQKISLTPTGKKTMFGDDY